MNIPRNASHSHLQEGDLVTVEGNFSSGLKAVLFAYVIPFVLMLITLLVLSGFTNNLVAGLSALGITIPYYAIIYLNKKHFEKQFSFIIK